MRKVLWLILLLIFLIGGIFGYRWWQEQQQLKSINSYEACAAAGYPILESYPPRCLTPDKRSFTQNVGNELEYRDEIVVSSPRPNEVIHTPLKVTGKARGSWYFEANFTAELYDGNDQLIGTSIMLAEGDWMTSEFVPFSGEIPFTKPKTTTGTLKLKNANPSGEPANDKTLTIPVKFS